MPNPTIFPQPSTLTPYLPGIFGFGRKSSLTAINDRDSLRTRLTIIENDLEDLKSVPFCKTYGLRLPSVANKTPEEIEALKAQRNEIMHKLGMDASASLAPGK